jgi:hypothetical protein
MERITYSATQETVKLGSTTTILAFQLETGEIRYSKAGISQLLGHAANWANRLRSESPNLLKALEDNGFTGQSERVKVKRHSLSGASFAETLSLNDLNALVTVESGRGNRKATALLSAGFRQYLIDQSRTAFGLAERPQKEKLADFSEWYDACQANYDDWGDIEEQETKLAQTTPPWWDSECYAPTAEGYDSDPDCHNPM